MENVVYSLKNANSTVVEFISGQQAVEELQKSDDFINNFSPFDIQSRLHSSSASLEDYFQFITQHILSWNESSIQSIVSCIDNLNTKSINQLELLSLPSKIFIVLTDGQDENCAAYCRNDNVIVVPAIMITSGQIKKIFIHELFHIWSRHSTNANIRNELYASIGYYPIPKENNYPFPDSLSAVKITNPDAPIVMKYYINLKKEGDPSENTYKCTPILFASQTFNPFFSTNFFEYLVPTTLILDDETFEPLQPLQLLSYDDTSNFYDQIGKNTSYTIHPEEINADHFVIWMTRMNNLDAVQSPGIIEKMNDIMNRSANEL